MTHSTLGDASRGGSKAKPFWEMPAEQLEPPRGTHPDKGITLVLALHPVQTPTGAGTHLGGVGTPQHSLGQSGCHCCAGTVSLGGDSV